MSNFIAPLTEALETLTDADHTLPWANELILRDENESAPFRAKVELDRRDGLLYLGLRLSHPTEPWCHTACVIILYPEGPKLRAAFSVDIQDYALPQDLVFQDVVTRHLAQAFDDLSHGLLHSAGLGQALLEQWQESADRLKTLWTAQRNQSMGVGKLSYLVEGGEKKVRPALAAPSTRPGKSQPVGVSQIAPDLGFSSIEYSTGKIHALGYYTHERLKQANRFSAQEQFDILQGRGSLHEDALREFHKVRLNKRIIPHPFPREKGVADVKDLLAGFEASVSLHSGNTGFVYFSPDLSREQGFRVIMTFPAQKQDLNIELDKGKLSIERNSVHETRFTTPELLDDLLPKVVEMIIDVDPVWPDWLKELFGDPSARTSPFLKGLVVPNRHQCFASAIFGAPYETAQKRARQLQALQAKKAQAVKDTTKQPKDFPDGMILAKLNKGAPSTSADLRASDISHFYYVKTTSAPTDKRRRRELVSPCSYFSNKPLTPKNLLKLEPLTTPATLQGKTDYYLGGTRRDFIEAAFHVALSLPPEAVNPLFAHEPTVMEFAFDQHNAKVRITRSTPQDGYAMLAFRVVNTPPSAPVCDARSGVLFLSTLAGEQSFALQSTLSKGDASILLDKEMIEGAISNTFASDPSRAKTLIGRMRWAFNVTE